MLGSTTELELEARRAERAGDWPRAHALWEDVTAHRPATPDLLFRLAQAAAYAGQPERAEAVARRIKDEQLPDGKLAMLNADIAERMQDFATALRWRKWAAKVQPDAYWAHFGAARAMQSLGYADEAIIAEMQQALRQPGAERQGKLFIAKVLFRCGQTDEANAIIDDCLEPGEREDWALAAMPGMTSDAERAVARWLAGECYTGKGSIVDLGCWLGSFTAALASGLGLNSKAGGRHRIIAIDKFAWCGSYMEKIWPGSRYGLAEDDDFLPWFKTFTSRWSPRIDVRKQDLAKASWDGSPIEILIVDAMKDQDLARRIIAEFFPSLIAGAYVLHQDFCHYYTWWIHLFHYQVRKKFELIDVVEGSGTVIFRLTQPFTPREIRMLLDTDLADAQLAKQAFAYSLSIVGPGDNAAVMRAYERCEAENGRAVTAL